MADGGQAPFVFFFSLSILLSSRDSMVPSSDISGHKCQFSCQASRGAYYNGIHGLQPLLCCHSALWNFISSYEVSLIGFCGFIILAQVAKEIVEYRWRLDSSRDGIVWLLIHATADHLLGAYYMCMVINDCRIISIFTRWDLQYFPRAFPETFLREDIAKVKVVPALMAFSSLVTMRGNQRVTPS